MFATITENNYTHRIKTHDPKSYVADPKLRHYRYIIIIMSCW